LRDLAKRLQVGGKKKQKKKWLVRRRGSEGLGQQKV
jgi:hypothetical protein